MAEATAAVKGSEAQGTAVTNDGSGQGLGRGARTAGANRVVPAVVWLSPVGHSGRAGLSYDDGRGSGVQGSGGDGQEEAGEGRRWCERKANPSPLLIAKPMQPKSPVPLNFTNLANLSVSASPHANQNF